MTEEVKVTAKDLRTTLKELSQKLITDPDQLDQFVKNWRSGWHTYSFYNQLLIWFQNPKATLCAGKWKWRDVKRELKPGERPMYILAPLFKKGTTQISTGPGAYKTIDSLVGFFSVPTYDISQTSGKELNIGGTQVFATNGMFDIFDPEKWSKIFGLPVRTYESTSDGQTDGKEILVANRENKVQMHAAFFHELAHCWLGHCGKNRESIDHKIKEVEAEAVCYLVCSLVGIDNQTARYYISHWGGKKEDLDHAERVLVVAERIITKLGWTKTKIENKNKRKYTKRNHQID
jgi:hypothetical protein